MLTLNLPQDLQALRDEFAVDNRINIASIWHPASCDLLEQTLRQQTQFDHAIVNEGKALSIPDQVLRELPAAEKQRIQQQLWQGAADGFGFYYGTHRIDRPQPSPTTPPLLQQVHQLLNSDAVLAAVRQISGFDDICYASAQATRYSSGHFLTRHSDVVAQEGRRVAYVFGFTKEWHPDWGGLLQFFSEDGQSKDSWTPTFNNLAMFDVRHPHSVTYITPFAKASRYSITGWFRANPPA